MNRASGACQNITKDLTCGHHRARREEKMIKNFSNLAKDINLQIQKVKEPQTG